LRYTERDEELREQFRAELAEVPGEQLGYRDETGRENNEARAYGWSPAGEPCWGEQPGQRTHRVSLIAALPHQELSAPLGFEGTGNPARCEAEGEHGWGPVLNPGQLVSYDNASCHQSANARRRIEEAGGTQTFLPPYSPDLHPSEHCWLPLKQRIRKYLPFYDRDLHKTIDAVLTQ